MVSIARKLIITWSVVHKLLTIFSLYMFLLCSSLLYCSARDTITYNNSISDERNETLVSAGARFELGFFTPNGSSSHQRYVGIWYYNSTPKTIVWVANRVIPLSNHSGIFKVTDDGNLKVIYGEGKSIWSTNLTSSSLKNTAKLMDSGNLVLRDDVSAEIVWESFSYPTDTFLPGMKMGQNLQLTSWKSHDDPAPGNFAFKKDEEVVDQFIISTKDKGVEKLTGYWRSEDDQTFLVAIAYLLSNFSTNSELPTAVADPSTATGGTGTQSSCGRNQLGQAYNSCPNPDLINRPGTPPGPPPPPPPPNTRLVMNFTGEIQYLIWDDQKKIWSVIWKAPRDQCGANNACGNFGSCNSNNGLVCKCLPGFEPSSSDNWNSLDFSGGCKRKSSICGKSGESGTLSLKMMKVKKPDMSLRDTDETECRKKCLGDCNCKAYSYEIDGNCSIWMEDLSHLQEEYAGGRNLSVRVNVSDIESTTRDCKPCGSNMIPYPLSTEPQCGDPTYFSFQCNISSGKVSFEAPNGTYYRVTSINPNKQTFVIQAKGANDICKFENSGGKIRHLNLSWPFRCNADPGNFILDVPFKGRDEVELGWVPPLEPTCNSSTDCKDWLNSTCKAALGGQKRCLCNANFRWNGTSLNCTHELSKGPGKMSMPLIIAVTLTIVIVLIAFSCTVVYYLRRRRVAKRQVNLENIQRNQALHFYDSERRVKDLIDSDQFREEDKKGIDVPFYDLESILTATDNFSDANKLGKGGFGPVYKGKFPGGREIAVKRLSSVTRQGLGEFKNEVVLIAKLQHRNLVRLLGYCITGEEKLLLYEYMPNKSLDSFIFDRTLCSVLYWELRFNIILGIARGLLYLHQDSRLRIIHRDLKTSNILLDEDMNPKISDFGLAKIFGSNQTEAKTNRVAGTYGYMSPEYAKSGVFSDKSDVFSFGVVVLEIISGKRNTELYQSEQALILLGYAWRLWNVDKALDLMDETLRETCNTNEFLKCVNVGLLCVQEDPNDRPTMSNVVFMLGSETATLPTPKQPAFMSSSSKSETGSINELTITAEEGR